MQNRSCRAIALFSTVAALAWLTAGGAFAAGIDDVVLAVVNEEQITRGRLAERLLDEKGETSLEKLINRTLVAQAAARLKLTATEGEVTIRLTELKSRFKNEPAYEQFLRTSGLTEAQLREETRNTILVQKVALHNAPIRPDELERFDIRMLVAPDRATAEKWATELQNGANFLAYATEKGADLALRESGGRMQPFIRAQMLEVAEAIAAQKLQPGQFTRSPVHLSSDRWVLIKLENVVPISMASPAERERLETVVTAYRVDRWLDVARKQAKIERRPLDQEVVAVVNGESLSRHVLVSRLLESHGEETLERMVNRLLLYQAAKRLNVGVTDAEADARLKEFRGQFKSEEAFREFLTRSSVGERQIREELRHTLLLERILAKEQPVTDEDLTRYDVRLIEVPDKATGEKWAKELDAGADFEKMARERSIDPEGRPVGGKMKPFIRVDLLDVWRVIDDAKLKPGAHTKTASLLSDGSWVLLKLESLMPASTLTKEEREKLTRQVMNYRMAMWPGQARRSAKISYPTALKTVVNPPGARAS